MALTLVPAAGCWPYLILRYAAAAKTSTTSTMTVTVMATMLPAGSSRESSAQPSATLSSAALGCNPAGHLQHGHPLWASQSPF